MLIQSIKMAQTQLQDSKGVGSSFDLNKCVLKAPWEGLPKAMVAKAIKRNVSEALLRRNYNR